VAATKFVRRLRKGLRSVPRVIVTDRLASYQVAHRERAMTRVTSIRHAQRLLSAFSGIWPHFRPRRHLGSAADYRQVMADRFAVWTEITGATTTAAA
jgi:putative transposase